MRKSKQRGEQHPNAKLSDDEVEMIRQLHEQHGLSYGTIAEKFEVSRSTAQHVCNYRRRT